MDGSNQIDSYISSLEGWKKELVSRLREIVLKSDSNIVEEWKWGAPVWSKDGLVCSVSAFKNHVGMNFFKGASLDDEGGIFNNGLDSKKMRSIKFLEGEKVNEKGIQGLIQASITLNEAG
ncbi:DUF1801 domain-containing protein [Candidatus Dojkabacteria bacterium]|nr:DUF1801 domain-containing protein [Candidatus Dojkabacteria bacterium]